MAEIAKLIATVGADISGLQSGMNQANGLLGNMGSVMKTAVIGAAAAGGAALVGLGAKSVSVAADFESQMNVLSVAAAGGGASLEDLRAAALAMGADTALVGISASQSADAMTNFAKAGLDTTAMFGDLNGYLSGNAELGGALRAAVDLAAASELDLATASDVVTVAMSTFGLSATDATGIADSFVMAADGSVASVGDLAAALTNVGPTAAAMGMSLDETNTALAMLSTRGIVGAEAGTALKSMLITMTGPATSTTASLQALGVSLYDAEGNMRALPDILADMSTGLAGMTQEQRNATIQSIAGTYGQKAMNTLLADGAAGWTDMEAAIAGAATAQESAQAQTQGFQAATEQLGGALETFMINVGTPLIENFLTPGVRLLTDWITELGNMLPSQEAVSSAFDTVKTAIGGIIDTVTGIVESGDPLAALWTLISGAIATQGPLLATSLSNVVQGMVDGAVDWITTNGATMAANLWTALKGLVTSAVDSLGGDTESVGLSLGTKVGDVISSGIGWLVTNVGPYATSLWNAFLGLLDSGLALFSENSTAVSGNWGQYIGSMLSQAISGIVTAVPGLAEALWGVIKGIFDSSTGGEGAEGGPSRAEQLAAGLIGLFTGFWNGFITGITGNPQWLTDLTLWIDTTILQPFRDIDLLAPMKTALQGIIDGTTEKAEEISTAITDIVGRIVNPFKEIDLAQIGRDLMDGLKNGISEKAGNVTDAVGNAADTAVDWLKQTTGIGSPSTVFADIGADLMRGLELGIERNTYRPREAIGQASSTVSNTFNLQATYGGQMPSNLEGLLTQLLQGMRGRGYSVPLPDMGGA